MNAAEAGVTTYCPLAKARIEAWESVEGIGRLGGSSDVPRRQRGEAIIAYSLRIQI